MARNIFEPPPELPPEDIRGGLANWFTYTYYDSKGNLVYGWGSGIGYDDGSTLLQMMGVSSVDDVPEFIENASPEQLRTLYAYKAAVENTENWNDLSNEEKNAILEEAGLGSPFDGGTEYAEGDQVAWEDMTAEERNAHAVRRYELTGEKNKHYEGLSQDEIDAAYEYLKTDGNPGIYGTQDGYDYVWENNKDYIIQQCESGAGCNADMQAWYDRWVYSGKPTDKSGMVDPNDEDYLEWLNSQGSGEGGGDDTGPEPTKTLGDLLDELAAEEEVDRDVLDGIVDIIETVKGSIPTDPESAIQTVKDILGSTILGSALEECESWTGTTTTDNGTVVPSWTKCVDVGIFGIPGLDLPLPPGMIDISTSVYDIIEKAEDIGQSFEDFINDPDGWLDGLVDKAIEKVQDIWGDITGAIDPKSTGGLLDILNDWLGNVLGGYILSQVKEKTEVLNPFLYAQDCSEEGFVEPYEGYCEEAGAVNCESQFNKAGGTVLNAAECGECLQEGFKDFGNGCEPVCQYDDSIPASNEECKEPWSNPDDAPTAEKCAAANKTFIPANVQNQEASKCGGCLEGYQPEGNECVEVLDPCPGNQVRNELTDECEDPPPEFVVGDPCKTVEGDNGTYDADGNCIADPPPEGCDNNATLDSECTQCQNGSLPSEHIDGDCSKGLVQVKCPQNTPKAGQMVNDLSECGTPVEPCPGNQQRFDGENCEEPCQFDTTIAASDADCIDPNTGTGPKAGDPCDSNGDGVNDGTLQPTGLGLGGEGGTLECVPGPSDECAEITEENYERCGKKSCGNGVYVDKDAECPSGGGDLCQDGSTPDPDKGCREDWCDDAMTIPKNEDGSCPEGPIEECVKPDGTPTGATVESGCEKCPQGQQFNDQGICVGPDPVICDDPKATNYGKEGKCVFGPDTDPCDDAVYASENPLECGWEECPDGSFAPTKEQCGGGGCPEGQEPCEALGGECTTPENCPGGDDGGGGGGGGAGMFTGAKPVEIGFDIAGDPQLLARQEFPITDYLAGLFKGIV